MENLVTWIICFAVTAFLGYGVYKKYSPDPRHASELGCLVLVLVIVVFVGFSIRYLWFRQSAETTNAPGAPVAQSVEAETKTTTIKPSEPLVIRVLPYWKLEHSAGVVRKEDRDGDDLIVTLSSEKEVTIQYRLYRP